MNSFSTKIIFGKEQISKFYLDEAFSENEFENNIKEYSFKSKKELNAFLKGVQETVGWLECYTLNESEFSKIKSFISK